MPLHHIDIDIPSGGADADLFGPMTNALLEGLVRVDMVQLQHDPSLWEAVTRARYRRERIGADKWKNVREIAADGVADCEDLASAWAAKFRVDRIDPNALAYAKPMGRERHPPFRKVWHIVVGLTDGTELDPSALALLVEKGRKTR